MLIIKRVQRLVALRKNQSIVVSVHKVKCAGISEKINEWKAEYIVKKINELPISRKEKIDCVDKIIENITKRQNS